MYNSDPLMYMTACMYVQLQNTVNKQKDINTNKDDR